MKYLFYKNEETYNEILLNLTASILVSITFSLIMCRESRVGKQKNESSHKKQRDYTLIELKPYKENTRIPIKLGPICQF